MRSALCFSWYGGIIQCSALPSRFFSPPYAPNRSTTPVSLLLLSSLSQTGSARGLRPRLWGLDPRLRAFVTKFQPRLYRSTCGRVLAILLYCLSISTRVRTERWHCKRWWSLTWLKVSTISWLCNRLNKIFRNDSTNFCHGKWRVFCVLFTPSGWSFLFPCNVLHMVSPWLWRWGGRMYAVFF